MAKIMRIFVQIPYQEKLVELDNSCNYIFNTPCKDWINNHNIEDYTFLDITHEGIEYKLPISDFKFMY